MGNYPCHLNFQYERLQFGCHLSPRAHLRTAVSRIICYVKAIGCHSLELYVLVFQLIGVSGRICVGAGNFQILTRTHKHKNTHTLYVDAHLYWYPEGYVAIESQLPRSGTDGSFIPHPDRYLLTPFWHRPHCLCGIINPRRACAARVTVLGLSVSQSVTILALQATKRHQSDTNSSSATSDRKLNK